MDPIDRLEYEGRVFADLLGAMKRAAPEHERPLITARAQVEGDPIRVRLLDEMYAVIEREERRATAIRGRQAGLFGGGR